MKEKQITERQLSIFQGKHSIQSEEYLLFFPTNSTPFIIGSNNYGFPETDKHRFVIELMIHLWIDKSQAPEGIHIFSTSLLDLRKSHDQDEIAEEDLYEGLKMTIDEINKWLQEKNIKDLDGSQMEMEYPALETLYLGNFLGKF